MTTTGDSIMQAHATAMSGPEFLDAVADASAGNGLDINAQVFRERALEWAGDKRTIEHLRAEVENLTDRLADVRRAALVL